MKGEGWLVKSFMGKGFIVFSLLLTFWGFSYSAFGASVNLGESTGAAGTDVTIPLTLSTGGLQIAATANDIAYNTALLENPRAALGPAGTAAGKMVVSSTPSPGVFRIGVLSLANNTAMGDGVIANVTFKVKDTAPPGDIPLANTPSASDPLGNPVQIGGTNGVIHVPEPTPAQLNLGSGRGAPGGAVTIPLTLVTNGKSISAVSSDLQYNPLLLLNPRATVGPAGSAAGKIVVSNVVGTGVFRVGVISLQNNSPMADGVVANVTFDISPTAQIGTDIPVDNTPSASDPDGGSVAVAGADGVVTVGGVEISTTSFPSILQDVNGFAGVQGQWPIQASGGDAPYTWSIIGGNLPNGLSLDPATGLISGRPLAKGVFPFTVKVVDQNLFEGTKDLSLKIVLLGDGDGNNSVAINELQIVINAYLGIYP